MLVFDLLQHRLSVPVLHATDNDLLSIPRCPSHAALTSISILTHISRGRQCSFPNIGSLPCPYGSIRLAWEWDYAKMQVVSLALKKKGISHVSLAASKEDRHSNLETFKEDPGCSVLLVILSTVGKLEQPCPFLAGKSPKYSAQVPLK